MNYYANGVFYVNDNIWDFLSSDEVSGIGPRAYQFIFYILRNVGIGEGEVYLYHEQLAKEFGLSTMTVRRYLKKLEGIGCIEQTENKCIYCVCDTLRVNKAPKKLINLYGNPVIPEDQE